MRTGAIFARGSCRALKWMALFGVVFALGTAQAAAQATFASAEFEPGGKTVTIMMNAVVYGSPANAAFAVMVDADGASGAGAAVANAVTAVSAGTQGSPRTDIALTVTTAIKSGSTVTVAYTAPTSATAAGHIKNSAGDNTASFDAATGVVGEKDVVPSLGAVDDLTLVVNQAMTPVVLHEGMGGNGMLAYSLADVLADPGATPAIPVLPPGLVFTAETRVLSGTPTMMKDHTMRYTVTDRAVTGGNVGADAGQSASQDFMISVKGEGHTPTTGVKVTVKSVTAAASVAEGGVLDVTVTAKVPAGTGTIPSRDVMVTFPTDNAKIMDGEAAEPDDFDVLGSTMWEKIPLKEEASEPTFKFRVEINRDLDAEDEKFQIAVQIDDDKPVATKDVLMIDDAQTQTYKLSLPSAAKGAIKEGAEDATTLTLKADPARTMNMPVSLAVNPNDPTKYALSALSASEFGMDPTSVTATVKAMADKNRTEDTITVTAYTTGTLGNNMELASLDIKVTDANPLPGVRARLVDKDGKALDPQPMSVTEGDTVMVMLTAVDKDGDSMKAGEDLSISLMAAGTAGAMDYRLSTNPIEIASGKESSAAVDLMVLADDDVGEEMLTFDAVVSGDEKVGPGSNPVMGVLSLTIMDGTMKLVWAKTQEEVEKAIYDAKAKGAGDDEIFSPGEKMEVMGNALFSAAEGVTLAYTAATDADAVATSTSGGMVTVTAMEAGMAHVTITAHATAPAGVKVLPQNEPDEASIMFPVEVGLEALSIMLSGPEDMNVAEGMSATVTATANRAVTADTTVMLMRDRAMSSASDDDYTADAITIEAGEEMGTTMVMAVEDSMAEDMEELVLYGMTEGMAGEVTGEVKLYLWDAAVPALPIIAQLLLAAFLAIGGYRRYRRR